jgi:hypothetical protein
MQGQHHYQHKLIHQFDMEALIPAYHLLCQVEQQVNIGFIRQLTAPYYCSHNGQPSIDPEILLPQRWFFGNGERSFHLKLLLMRKEKFPERHFDLIQFLQWQLLMLSQIINGL